MWAPIIFNFLATLVTIIGLFGAYYRRPSYLSLFAVWQVAALGWNAFVAAFYLELGVLRRDSDILSLGTGSRSWWQANGPNCEPQYNITHYTTSLDTKPVSVEGCLLPFHTIEVVQAAIHFLLSTMGLILAVCLLCAKRKEDDSCMYLTDCDHYVSRDVFWSHYVTTRSSAAVASPELSLYDRTFYDI